MKNSEWNEGLSNIDPDLVEEYVKKKEKLAGVKKRSSALLRIGAVAACLVLVVGIVVAVPMLRRGEEPKLPAGDKTPIFPNDTKVIAITAEDVAKVFPIYMDLSGTNQYSKVYSTSSEKLNITAPPVAEYLPVYSVSENEISEEQLQDFIDKYLGSASKYFGFTPSAYVIESSDRHDEKYSYSADINEYYANGFNNPACDRLIFSINKSNHLTFWNYITGNYILSLEDPLLESDTDEQIKDKLKGVCEQVYDSFGKKYKDIKIERVYREDGFRMIYVYLYTKSDTVFMDGFFKHPLASDYITLTYRTNDNAEHWEGTKDEAYLCDFQLTEAVENWSEYYNVFGKSKMLSLNEAEELLQKGYVFGGHTCSLCMQNQSLVDFTDYACVGFEYLTDYNANIVLPFYTFYKYIGESTYGMKTFARTYVPAIEVEGLEKHFESQTKYHQSWGDIIVEDETA